jgi:hypothetical protein
MLDSKYLDAAVDTKRTSSWQSCASPGHISSFGYIPYKARTIPCHQTRAQILLYLFDEQCQWLMPMAHSC